VSHVENPAGIFRAQMTYTTGLQNSIPVLNPHSDFRRSEAHQVLALTCHEKLSEAARSEGALLSYGLAGIFTLPSFDIIICIEQRRP